MRATLKHRVIAESDDIVDGSAAITISRTRMFGLIFWRRARRQHSTANVRMASSSTMWLSTARGTNAPLGAMKRRFLR